MWQFHAALLLSIVSCGVSLDNGLVRTPPMGWLSWAKFMCEIDCVKHPLTCISEQLYVDMADILVNEGYAALGYTLVNIDDCWPLHQRDEQGRLQVNVRRFAHGIPWLADYMHERGLKLGIYEDFGTLTCGGYPGSLGHLQVDANTFADWNVDMLKLDGCYVNTSLMDEGYPNMTKCLNATGRPIVYSCSWPAYLVGEHIKPDYKRIAKYCNLWRNYNDIGLSWGSIQSIINYYDRHQDDLIPVNGPGQWNDPDMIIVGNPEITVDQAKAQFAIWSMWSAPLLMSNDLRFMAPKFKAILQNRKIIAINQDPLGIMGRLVANTTNLGVYVKAVTPVDQTTGQHSYAIAFLNRHLKKKATATVVLGQLGLRNVAGYMVEDLYTDRQYGLLEPQDSFSCGINPTGVAMLKATIKMTLNDVLSNTV